MFALVEMIDKDMLHVLLLSPIVIFADYRLPQQ